jgi:hypothetical protein
MQRVSPNELFSPNIIPIFGQSSFYSINSVFAPPIIPPTAPLDLILNPKYLECRECLFQTLRFNSVEAKFQCQQEELVRHNQELTLKYNELKGKYTDLFELHQRKLKELTDENEKLKAQLSAPKKNSRNSHINPSSNITRPPKKKTEEENGEKKKKGGQKNHPPHIRTPFRDDEINNFKIFQPELGDVCECGSAMERFAEADKFQDQYELNDNPILKRRFQSYA